MYFLRSKTFVTLLRSSFFQPSLTKLPLFPLLLIKGELICTSIDLFYKYVSLCRHVCQESRLGAGGLVPTLQRQDGFQVVLHACSERIFFCHKASKNQYVDL